MKRKQKASLVWLRRDLRLDDNHALYQAIRAGFPVQLVFVFDRNILDGLRDQSDRRVSFIHHTLEGIHARAKRHGGALFTFYGTPDEAFLHLKDEFHVQGVYCNRDYEPYARERDGLIGNLMHDLNIPFYHFKDQVLFEEQEILTKTGKPYSVYTPYSKSWLRLLEEDMLDAYPSGQMLDKLVRVHDPEPVVPLEEMGFKRNLTHIPDSALDPEKIRRYGELRDLPAIDVPSRLGIHLRFGTVSTRDMVRQARDLDRVWLAQLIWREFFMQILHNFPHAASGPFRKEYSNIPWLNDEAAFRRWCEGRTGYPIVDAGMRELNATGYMHNRVRMVTASFLCKHLLIDWRWGERYFAEKLLDFELAANNGNWQWAAGTGCDAAPYFRVFNPWRQTERFDPDMVYIKKWVPEFLGPDYPAPMVDHNFARKRAVETYKKGLGLYQEREEGEQQAGLPL